MFGIERGPIIAVIAVITCLYPLWGTFLKKNRHSEKAKMTDALRRGRVEEKIQALGGKVIDLESVKRSECPVIDVVEIGQQVNYTCYRVSYSLDSRIEETWALVNAKSTKEAILWPELEEDEEA